jgi:hypothetical protein
MNLLVKRIALFISVSFVLFSCEDPTDIGLPPEQSVGVFFMDTLTVQLSTVRYDSIYSSLPPYLLVGRYTDSRLGNVSSRSFLDIGPRLGDETFTLGENPVIDSLEVILVDQYAYGDTTQLQQINVHRLTGILDRNRETPYLTSDTMPYEDIPLGSGSFRATPNIRTDTLKIRLSDDFAAELLNYVGQTREEFINSVRGLALVPGSEDNAAIIGFSGIPSTGIGASKIRMYYRSGPNQTSGVYDFPVGVNTMAFNQVQSDLSGTNLADLPVHVPLPANQTNDEAFVQAATSLRVKVEIPHLLALAELGNIAINRAELEISPVLNTNGEFKAVPPRLVMYRSGPDNKPRVTEAVINNALRKVFVAIPGDFNSEAVQQVPYNADKNAYTFRLTSYVQALLNGRYTNEGLLLSLPSGISENVTSISANVTNEFSLNRMVVGSSAHPSNPVKLKIYYTLIR